MSWGTLLVASELRTERGPDGWLLAEEETLGKAAGQEAIFPIELAFGWALRGRIWAAGEKSAYSTWRRGGRGLGSQVF